MNFGEKQENEKTKQNKKKKEKRKGKKEENKRRRGEVQIERPQKQMAMHACPLLFTCDVKLEGISIYASLFI